MGVSLRYGKIIGPVDETKVSIATLNKSIDEGKIFKASNDSVFEDRGYPKDSLFWVKWVQSIRVMPNYNSFRNELCLRVYNLSDKTVLKNCEEWKGKAFMELIDFNDDRGHLKKEVLRKLSKDHDKYPFIFDYKKEDKYKENWNLYTYQFLGIAFKYADILEFC